MIILKKAKRLYILASRMRRLARKEQATPSPIRFATRLDAWRQGFLGESSAFYDWARNRPREYVSDLERFLFVPDINGQHAVILDDKAVFRKVVGLVLPVPRHIGIIERGVLVRGDDYREVAVERLFHEESAFVAKPVSGGGGSSILVFERSRDGWTINGKDHGRESPIAVLRGLTANIVQERVANGEYAARIHAATLNTVRILTMADPRLGGAFIAAAIHRFGASRSAPADNWTQGGLSVALDVETGVLGKGATYPMDGRLRWHSVHPETGVQIEGVAVPGWAAIRREILRAADVFAHVPYIGWDVVAREDAFVVIEGNSNTDVNLLQIHGPLLKDPRVHEFYQSHGALVSRR